MSTLPKTTIFIDPAPFTSPDGPSKAHVIKLAVGVTEEEVLDGNLIPTTNAGFENYYLFAFPRLASVTGDNPFVTDGSGRTVAPHSKRVTVDDVWGITLLRPTFDGLLLVETVLQGGFVSNGVKGSVISSTPQSAIEGGQYYNMTGHPFGFYQFVIRFDPLGKWSENNVPVIVKMKFTLAGSTLLTDFPPEAFLQSADPAPILAAQAADIGAIKTDIAGIKADIARLQVVGNRLQFNK